MKTLSMTFSLMPPSVETNKSFICSNTLVPESMTSFSKLPGWFSLSTMRCILKLLRLTRLMAFWFRCIRKGKVWSLKPGRGTRSVHDVSSAVGHSILNSERCFLLTRPTHGTPQHPTAKTSGLTSTRAVTRWSVSRKSVETMKRFHGASYLAK